MKKLIISVITIILIQILGLQISASAKSSANLTNIGYEKFLNNYSKEDAMKAGVSNKFVPSAVVEARHQLLIFKHLSKNQKKEYLKALTTGRVKLYKNKTSDVSVVQKAKAKKGSKNKVKIKTVAYTFDWKPGKYAPSIMKFRDTITYEVRGKKVLKTKNSDNYVLHNWNPLASLTKKKNKRYVTHNLAYTYARYQYVLGVHGYGVDLGNINLSIWGDYKGQLSNYRAWKN